MNIEIDKKRLFLLRSYAQERLKTISRAKVDISHKTSLLIKLIESLHAEAIEKLNTVSQICLEVAQKVEFFESDLQTIEDFEKKTITIETFELASTRNEIIRAYSKKLINFTNIHPEKSKKYLRESRCNEIERKNRLLLSYV